MAQAAQTPPPAPPQTPRQRPPQAAPAPLPTLEQSFELLKEFKVGTDSTVLIPIERAVMEVHGNETARAALEKRLVAYLGSTYPYVTRSFVCRQLVLIGSAASVPAVTPLVLDEELSVHARNVLEHVPGPESEKALRDALGQAKGRTRIGVINSVAARRDAASTPALIKILGEDPDSAAAAAKALGEIGTSEAAKALTAARGKGPALGAESRCGRHADLRRPARGGRPAQSSDHTARRLDRASQPEHVRLAAEKDAVRRDTQVIAARHRHGAEAQGRNREVAPLLVRLFPSACSVPASRPSGAGTARQRATCQRVSRSHDGRDLFSEDRDSQRRAGNSRSSRCRSGAPLHPRSHRRAHVHLGPGLGALSIQPIHEPRTVHRRARDVRGVQVVTRGGEC